MLKFIYRYALIIFLIGLSGCAAPNSPTPLAYYLNHGTPLYGYSPYAAGYAAGAYYTQTDNHNTVIFY